MKKELLKKINFCTDVLNVFDIYASCLDEYFKDGDNKENHIELYNYYMQLRINLNNLLKGKK